MLLSWRRMTPEATSAIPQGQHPEMLPWPGLFREDNFFKRSLDRSAVSLPRDDQRPSTFNGEGNLRVDPIAGDPVVLDLSLEFLDIDRGDAAHRLGGLLNHGLSRLPPAVRGLGKNFDHLDQSHDDSS